MGKHRSLRSKAVNLVSELTTVLLNPISDKPSKNLSPGNEFEEDKSQAESMTEEGSVASVEGPDTSSFTAFLYSLLKDDHFSADGGNEQPNSKSSSAASSESELEPEPEMDAKPVSQSEPENAKKVKENGGRRGLLSRGRERVGKAMSYAARLAWFRSQASEKKSDSADSVDGKNEYQEVVEELKPTELEVDNVPLSLADLPDISEPSMLLNQATRLKLYASLPSLVKGRKWVLLYSTWRHGISLSTLYRKSKLCPGLSLLVVGDQAGAVFGGLVEAPLKPNIKRKYQGTNSTLLFTNVPGQPVVYRPTGVNRYYTLCSPDFLALGGGSHFALYLDSDLLAGSSAASETYGNPCLSLSQDFQVKEVELWGFEYASRYEETLALSQNEPPGICRW